MYFNMTYFKSYWYHIIKRTPLGKAMLKDPIQAFFFIMRGNLIDSDDWVSNLYRKYAKLKWRN